MNNKSGLSKFFTAVGAIVAIAAAVAGAFAIFKKYFKKKDEELDYVFSETFEDEEIEDEAPTEE